MAFLFYISKLIGKQVLLSLPCTFDEAAFAEVYISIANDFLGIWLIKSQNILRQEPALEIKWKKFIRFCMGTRLTRDSHSAYARLKLGVHLN